MKFILLCVALLVALNTNAQTSHTIDTVTKGVSYFHYVEQMPTPDYDLKKYISKNLHYPGSESVAMIDGKVVVKFVVNEDGSISDCQIVRNIDKYCDTEALRVVKNMPRWKPGKQNGKPVKVWFSLPIYIDQE